jgi:hypothetical protein
MIYWVQQSISNQQQRDIYKVMGVLIEAPLSGGLSEIH